jgi:hypothetical protein
MYQLEKKMVAEREGPGRRCGRISRWGLKFSATSYAPVFQHMLGRAGHPFLPGYDISQVGIGLK